MEVPKKMPVKYNIVSKLHLPVWKPLLSHFDLTLVAYGSTVELIEKPSKKVLGNITVPNSTIGGVMSGHMAAIKDMSTKVDSWLNAHYGQMVPQAKMQEEAKNEVEAQIEGPYDPPPSNKYVMAGDGHITKVKAADEDAGPATYRFGKTHVDPAIFGCPRMRLKDAGVLYQPVHGSTPGSQYFVVAMGQTPGHGRVVLAARVNVAGSVSTRLEGDLLEMGGDESLSKRLYQAAALQLQTKKDGHPNQDEAWKHYASSHMKIQGGPPEAHRGVTRTLVGVMGALAEEFEIEWNTPVPSGGDLWGKGKGG